LEDSLEKIEVVGVVVAVYFEDEKYYSDCEAADWEAGTI
jgi:hypothetical protein